MAVTSGSRRQALGAAGAFLLAAMASAMTLSCGGDTTVPGNNGDNNGSNGDLPQTVDLLGSGTIATAEAAGTVDTAEIGGAGLRILSLHDPGGGAVSGTSFSVTVADVSAQLLMAADGEGALRGMAVTLPAASGASARAALNMDAESTATAYVLLCCGIGSPGPETCASRIAEIQGYASFAPLVERLRQDLPTTSLEALSGDESFRLLVQAVVSEWYTTHGGQQASALYHRPDVGVDFTEPPDEAWKIFFDFPATAAPEVAVSVRNAGYRAVDVRRRTVGAGGTVTWHTIANYSDPDLMGGSLGWSEQGVVVGLLGRDTVVADTLPAGAVENSQYWVAGPGFSTHVTAPPADWPAPDSGAPAWGVSMASTMLWPMAAMLAGTGLTEAQVHEGGPPFGVGCWAAFGDATGVLPPIANLIAQGPGWDQTRRFEEEKSFLQALVAAMSTGTGTSTLAELVGVTEAQASVLNDLLKGAVDSLTLAHVVLAHLPWNEQPSVTVYDLRPRAPVARLGVSFPAIPADGETTSLVSYRLKEWSEEDTPGVGDPTGAPVAGIPVTLHTSMGVFQTTGTTTCHGVTDGQGGVSAPLLSSAPGTARVTAEVPDYDGYEAQTEVHFASVSLSPSRAGSADQSTTVLRCAVSGPPLDDVAYKWTKDKWGWLVEAGTGKAVTTSTAEVEWGRTSGEAAQSSVKVTAFYVGEGCYDPEGDYLGEAQTIIDITEMRYPVILMGIVDRGTGHTGCAYGCKFEKLERGDAYGLYGSGFNDPLVYGTSFSGGIRIGFEPSLRDLGTHWFYPLTSGGGSYDPRSDEEIIADYSWRFQGGTWYMIPHFCPPYTEPPA